MNDLTDSPELSAEELRLHLGELTPREVEVARAAIRYVRADCPAPARVKALTEDDFEEIENDAHAEWRKVERERGSVRPATITHLDSEAWWIMRATERRILAALEPAPEVDELRRAAETILTANQGPDYARAIKAMHGMMPIGRTLDEAKIAATFFLGALADCEEG